MRKFVCKKCGHIENINELHEDFVCPVCNSSYEEFNEIEELIAENEIDAIINSVVEDALEIKASRIVNNVEEDILT